VLETAEFYGPDRDVLRDLSKAYREGGDPLKAQQVDQQLQLLVQNRLF